MVRLLSLDNLLQAVSLFRGHHDRPWPPLSPCPPFIPSLILSQGQRFISVSLENSSTPVTWTRESLYQTDQVFDWVDLFESETQTGQRASHIFFVSFLLDNDASLNLALVFQPYITSIPQSNIVDETFAENIPWMFHIPFSLLCISGYQLAAHGPNPACQTVQFGPWLDSKIVRLKDCIVQYSTLYYYSIGITTCSPCKSMRGSECLGQTLNSLKIFWQCADFSNLWMNQRENNRVVHVVAGVGFKAKGLASGDDWGLEKKFHVFPVMKEPLQCSEEIKEELSFFMPAHLLVWSLILGHKESVFYGRKHTHTHTRPCCS